MPNSGSGYGTNLGGAVTSTLNIDLTDANGLAILAHCTGTPPTTAGIFAPGCMIISDNGSNYTNTGTSATPSFLQSDNASSIQTTQVSLTATQIKALNATPVTLIAAAGAGTVIAVRGVTLKMVTTATGYANGGALEFRYTDTAGAKVTADIAVGVVTAGAGTSYTSVAGVTTSLTNVANAPIVIDNATAPFITGTGTAVVTIAYQILTP